MGSNAMCRDTTDGLMVYLGVPVYTSALFIVHNTLPKGFTSMVCAETTRRQSMTKIKRRKSLSECKTQTIIYKYQKQAPRMVETGTWDTLVPAPRIRSTRQ